jgi:hypothetical protein
VTIITTISAIWYLSSQIIEHEKTMTSADEYPGPDFRQAQKCGRIKWLNPQSLYEQGLIIKQID